MTIATESVNETEIENASRAGDHRRENGNLNGNGNVKEIAATNAETLRIGPDIKPNRRSMNRRKRIEEEEEEEEEEEDGRVACSVLFHRRCRCKLRRETDPRGRRHAPPHLLEGTRSRIFVRVTIITISILSSTSLISLRENFRSIDTAELNALLIQAFY